MKKPETLSSSEMVATTLRFGRRRVALVVACLLSVLYLANVFLSPPFGLALMHRSRTCLLPVQNSNAIIRNHSSRPLVATSRRERKIFSEADVVDSSADETVVEGGSSDDRNVALDDVVPATLFFVWCAARHRTFDFRHYLSIRSAIVAFRPDSIWFYYTLEPSVDRWTYGTWLRELADEFPFFVRRPVYDLGHLDVCVNEHPSEDFIAWLVSSRGGLYVDIETVVADFSPDLRFLDAFVAYDETLSNDSKNPRRRIRMMMSQPDRLCVGTDPTVFDKHRVVVANCAVVVKHQNRLTTSGRSATPASPPVCLVMPKLLYPRDLWVDNSGDFRRYLVRAMYDTDELRKPAAVYDDLIPNIAHVIWIGGGEMKFAFFLSVLSLLHCACIDEVYLHGDQKLTGAYWNMLVNNQSGRVKFVQREDIGKVYGQSVDFRSHISDVWRADILFKYGGVYLDSDAFFVQPLTKEVRAYEAVAAYDWPLWHSPFPEIFNLGVTLGKPGARFWRLFQESMKDFRDFDFSWNGLRQPYRIFERHPDLVYVEPRLQVICFQLRCHPTWWPGYHNPAVDHLRPPVGAVPLNWRNDTFAFHFTNPTPHEYDDPCTLLSSNGMFAEIGHHILNRSKLWDYFYSECHRS